MEIDHAKYMSFALEEARKSYLMNEVPVGAIIVMNGKIVASSHNMPISKNDPSSHAEINAIRIAAKKIRNYRLTGAKIYVTLEPCAMCYGAIIHSRIEELIFGAHDPKTGVCGTSENFKALECFNHQPRVVGGVLESESSNLLRKFFRDIRA